METGLVFAASVDQVLHVIELHDVEPYCVEFVHEVQHEQGQLVHPELSPSITVSSSSTAPVTICSA